MSEKLNVRAASAAEIKDIYEQWMTQQFHADELKPLSAIEKLCARGEYEVYGMWDEQALVAYALFGVESSGFSALLDYYAVLPNCQDHGYGGIFLAKLKEVFRALGRETIILEVENPEFVEDADEKDKAERRLRFYERNGCEYTNIRVKLFGFEYLIMVLCMDERTSDDEVNAGLDKIYKIFFTPEIYAKNAQVRREVMN